MLTEILISFFSQLFDVDNGPFDDDFSEDSSWLITLFAWLINLLVLVFVLLRTMVNGEPFIERHSKAASIYWQQRKQADYDMNNVNKLVYSRIFPLFFLVFDFF